MILCTYGLRRECLRSDVWRSVQVFESCKFASGD